jgi:hypothetical protein
MGWMDFTHDTPKRKAGSVFRESARRPAKRGSGWGASRAPDLLPYAMETRMAERGFLKPLSSHELLAVAGG